MPTSPKVKKRLFQELPSDFQGSIVDLGSGWGTMLSLLSKKYPSCQVVGYESSPIPFAMSKLNNLIIKNSHVEIYKKNFYHVSLDSYDMVICYLFPNAMSLLKEKFEKELKNNTLVVTHTFAITGWKPYKVIECQDLYRTKIYFYLYSK